MSWEGASPPTQQSLDPKMDRSSGPNLERKEGLRAGDESHKGTPEDLQWSREQNRLGSKLQGHALLTAFITCYILDLF